MAIPVLQYTVTKDENGFRKITVFKSLKVVFELECLPDIMSDEEEIQFHLDTIEMDDTEYVFERLETNLA